MKGKSKSAPRADDCPLTYPDLKALDHARHCPMYTEVLHRDPVTGTLAIEDVDALLNDLHTLLGAVTDRIKTLQAETDILVAWQDGKKVDKRSPDSTASPAPLPPLAPPLQQQQPLPAAELQPPPVNLKREREPADEPEKISKRLKDSGFQREAVASAAALAPAAVAATVTPVAGVAAGPSAAASVVAAATAAAAAAALTAMTPRPGGGRSRVSKMVKSESDVADRTDPLGGDVARAPKSDAPEKFWTMVEPYCAEITADDLKVLEEILRSHEDDAEYYKVPSLGKHYAQKWAMEDMIEEKKEGSKIHVDKRTPAVDANPSDLDSSVHGSVDDGEDASQKLQQASNDFGIDNDSPFGPLTQRLISALIEENVMTPVDDVSLEDVTGGKDASESIASIDPRTLAKQLNLRGQGDLEYQIRRELEAEGILDSDETSEGGSPEGDEILAELKKKQELLRAVSQQNQQMTRRLQKLAREEMMRQDMRKKLTAIDADVTDAYRRVQASRQKRKSPTKKEKDLMLKALKERDAIVRQLEGAGSSAAGTSSGSLLTSKDNFRLH